MRRQTWCGAQVGLAECGSYDGEDEPDHKDWEPQPSGEPEDEDGVDEEVSHSICRFVE